MALGVWRTRLIPFGWGLLGMVTALLLYHAWSDHVAFHTLINLWNEHWPAIQKLPK